MADLRFMLTDREAVFRSIESELGLGPVYHQKDERTEGHLFILLAYQAVKALRQKLKTDGVTDNWSTLRDTFPFSSV